MSKDKIQLLSPLFLKYQTDYEKNPRSRVFAPLAEIYRKLGMTDKAMEILSQGIRFHPTYNMGYLGLAFCYFDIKQFSLAYTTLRPLLESSRDNIRLQKLFAEICIELGHKEEALDTYKYLLFINPRDRDVALHVSNLERLIYEQYKPSHRPIYIPESEFISEKNILSKRAESDNQKLFDIDKLENRPNSNLNDFDDWMALDLSRNQKTTAVEDPHDLWNLKKGYIPVDLSDTNVEIKIPQLVTVRVEEEKNQANRPYVELDFNDEIRQDEEVEHNAPLVTHTLVDLYCGQGHIEKALEVLEKILILNPKDQKTIKKIFEIKMLMGTHHNEEIAELQLASKNHIENTHILNKSHSDLLYNLSEEDGRKNLMSIFDQQIKHVEIQEEKPKKSSGKTSPLKSQMPVSLQAKSKAELDKTRSVEEKLNLFLKKIQKRALDYQARS